MKINKAQWLKSLQKPSRYRGQKGWINVGGKKYYMKSLWERNYARYLNFLKDCKSIKDWEYEPFTFLFDAIRSGTRTYKPDFKVYENNGKYVWHEVKGWMDSRSFTKLKRMAKYFPNERILLIDKEQYYAIARQVKKLIPNWETI